MLHREVYNAERKKTLDQLREGKPLGRYLVFLCEVHSDPDATRATRVRCWAGCGTALGSTGAGRERARGAMLPTSGGCGATALT